MTTQTRTILITGGAGYIGSACTKALCEDGHRVVVFDNLSNGDTRYVDERAVCVEGDILDMSALASVFREHTPDTVVHLAALKAVGESEREPERYFTTNVSGSLNVLNAARAHDVAHFLFSSTAAVYRQQDSGRYREDDPLEPSSVYGTSKQMAEHAITAYARLGALPYCTVFRYFNVAGDVGLRYQEKQPENLFVRIAQALSSGEQLSVYGDDYATPDGTGVRDYIHLADIADAHVRAIRQRTSGTYNLGTGEGHSVREVIAAFERLSGMQVPHTTAPRRDGDGATATAVAKRAHQELGWNAQRSLEDMVRTTLAAYSLA